MGFDWRKSEAHLLLLSKYIHANCFEDFARHDFWKNWWDSLLGEPSSKAIKWFVDQSMLMTTTDLNDLLSYKYKVTELKDMLKQRSLPVSGLKDELIKRLVQTDPNGMRKTVTGLTLLKCTQRGHEIAEQYLVTEKEERAKVEHQVLEYLKNRKFKEASLAFAAWEREQVFPLGLTTGIGTESKHPNRDRDVETSQHRIEMLNTIFESKPPKIIARLGNEKLEAVRIAAAMMALWGENKAKKWLPADFETGLPFDNDTVVRMINFYATHRATLEQYRSEGLKHIEVLPAPDSCESCKKLAGKHYRLAEAPELPYENCTHKMGCRCCYLPVV
jgi:hypothetical protein